MILRAIALIDGFNFYHPISEHQKRLRVCLQWLDYRSMLSEFALRNRTLPEHQLNEVYFFSALAKHRNETHPGTTQRHLTYINALKSSGINVILGNFKAKHSSFSYQCKQRATNSACRIEQLRHEEKETDVRIACKLLELAITDRFDICYLLSADSDLVPALETLNTLYSNKKVILVTPPSKAKFHKLQSLSADHISVSVNHLKQFQYPNELITNNGCYKLSNPWQSL